MSASLHGVERAREAAVRQRRSEFVKGLLKKELVIPFDLAMARAHARIWAELVVAGLLFDTHDMQIAANSLVAGSTVATLNTAEFSQVSRLSLEELPPFMQT